MHHVSGSENFPDDLAFFLVEKIAFGLADGFEREMGYVSIEELESILGPMKQKIERDLHWKPKPLSEAIQELNNRGHQDRLDQEQDQDNDLHR